MNKITKHNKRKVWRETYGKVFARKSAYLTMEMGVVAAAGMANLSAVICHGGKISAANVVVDTANAIANLSKKMNTGRIK